MLKLHIIKVTAVAGKFGHSSGTFCHQRGYIRSVDSLNVFGRVT